MFPFTKVELSILVLRSLVRLSRKNSSVKGIDSHNLRHNNLASDQQSRIIMSQSLMIPNEPIYETIPEVSENEMEQVYSLPFDNLRHHALVSPVRSNKQG